LFEKPDSSIPFIHSLAANFPSIHTEKEYDRRCRTVRCVQCYPICCVYSMNCGEMLAVYDGSIKFIIMQLINI